jgi:drug/metabolite transporter (DMT)-like permease
MHLRSPSLFDSTSTTTTTDWQTNLGTNTNNSTTTTTTSGIRSPIPVVSTTARRHRISSTIHNSNTSTNSHLIVDSGDSTCSKSSSALQQPPHLPRTTVSIATTTAIPGRPRRRRVVPKRNQGRFIQYSQVMVSTRNSARQLLRTIQGSIIHIDLSLLVAILLWYSLGVVSIASSKILLSGSNHPAVVSIRVNPLCLTLQQLMIGVTLLRFVLQLKCMNTSGITVWPPPVENGTTSTTTTTTKSGIQRPISNKIATKWNACQMDLFRSAMCFACGFLATNYAFAGSAASFVETVKAAEPITSATIAALYGIETITLPQTMSLATIVAGVLLSTLGGSSSSSGVHQTMIDTVRTSVIVMMANLCFSYRGLYQKLFRQHPMSQSLDDMNLQYRMQWFGVLLLIVPTVLFDIMPYLLREILLSRTVTTTIVERHLEDIWTFDVMSHYIVLSLFNGMAFTFYNLASTWILSRISVVHHAALNCIRRVFAVIVTSLYFGIPITLFGAIGIGLAVIGFMAYTHYKVLQQQQQQKQISMTTTTSSGQNRTNQPPKSILPLYIHDK